MFERLLFLFKQGRLNSEQLEVAVSKTWITEEQKQEIIANK
ncbi:XkdX family protein [Clostridium neonatale]